MNIVKWHRQLSVIIAFGKTWFEYLLRQNVIIFREKIEILVGDLEYINIHVKGT